MSQTVPQICALSHPGFSKLGDLFFRLSEGARLPSMVIQLDSQEAVLPLRSVAREFQIEADSADGQMLNLIEQALDFVVALRPGDKLPSELTGGEASWQPNEQDARLALSRIRHNLVRGVFARLGKVVTINGGNAPDWEEDPQNRALLVEAIAGAATQIDDAKEDDIAVRIAAISQEMAYIETLRRTLGRGINFMQTKLLRIQMDQVAISRQDTIKQVQDLARRGLNGILSRFDSIDIRLDDVIPSLRSTPDAVAWLRGERNWLYRTENAWKAILAEWANAPQHYDDFLWKVVERSYVFLAPRYMTVHEWTTQDAKFKKDAMKAKVW